MEIHPIQNFKAMPTKKKVAVVAGTLAGAAALGVTTAAIIKGRKSDAFQALKNDKDAKFFTKVKTMFKEARMPLTPPS